MVMCETPAYTRELRQIRNPADEFSYSIPAIGDKFSGSEAMTRVLRQPAVWFGEHVNIALLLLICIAGGALVFITIADEVVNHRTQSFDESVLRALRTP